MEMQQSQTVPEVQSDSPQSKGERTRIRLLDLAQQSIIEKGFNATSIEELVDAAGITKSGFFYHFRDKQDLARQLVEYWIEDDTTTWDRLEKRARELSDDPLQSFLIFIKLFAETMEDFARRPSGLPCLGHNLPGSFVRSRGQALSAEGALLWRKRFMNWIGEIAALYPPRVPIDEQALADHLGGHCGWRHRLVPRLRRQAVRRPSGTCVSRSGKGVVPTCGGRRIVTLQ